MEGTNPPGLAGPPEKTGGMAIASLILSIVGICCFVPAIVGLALGFMEINNIKNGRSSAKGYGIARAAIIIAIVAILLDVAYWIYLISTGGFNFEFGAQS